MGDAKTPDRPTEPSTGVPVGSFRITVETSHGALLPQTLPASSLREALTSAYQLPLSRWFPDED